MWKAYHQIPVPPLLFKHVLLGNMDSSDGPCGSKLIPCIWACFVGIAFSSSSSEYAMQNSDLKYDFVPTWLKFLYILYSFNVLRRVLIINLSSKNEKKTISLQFI